MAWYDTGTVNVTANSVTVTGVGTQWLAGARQGEAFVGPDGRLYEVLNVASNTSLTLTKPYRGPTASGQQYALAPMQGYVKELADRAAQLLPAVADIGTAAKGTLTASNTDTTVGRVLRVGDHGLGGISGLIADQNVLNNHANGFYRSGSGDTGTPDGLTGAGYIKFGWSSSYKTLLYASPIADKFWMRNVENGTAKAWKELMTVGMFGIGRDGAATDDRFPAASLNETGVPAGLHYVAPDIGLASDLPAGINTQGVVVHRQTGSGGGQIYVSFLGEALVRGRRSSAYNPWRVLWHSGNTTVDSNGFIKRASPIVQLYADRIERSDHLEIRDVVLEHVGVGHYVLRNVPLLSRDGWYIETPKDRNGNIYFHMDYEEDLGERTLTIKTTTPDYSTGRAEAGEPVDILEGRFISLRFAEDPSLYPEELEAEGETED